MTFTSQSLYLASSCRTLSQPDACAGTGAVTGVGSEGSTGSAGGIILTVQLLQPIGSALGA